jgi:hypothetical protein
MRASAFLAAGLALVAAACAYSPNPESGKLFCAADRSCPEGYQCQADGKCYKKGAATSGSGGAVGTGGATGADAGADHGSAGGTTSTDAGADRVSPLDAGACPLTSGTPAAKFVGHWLYAATATNMVTCSDGSSSTMSLAMDYVDVSLGASTGVDLQASYYCTWNMMLGGGGNSASAISGQSCPYTDPANGTMWVWHGDSFVFSTSDGCSGSVMAAISADFKDAAGATGTCTIKVSGPLTKMR